MTTAAPPDARPPGRYGTAANPGGTAAPGALDGGHSPFGGDDAADLSDRQPRLRIASHVADRVALSRLRITAGGTGLVLGTDREEQPVIVRFFRPEPTLVTLVGGAWAARLLAFRALALGARLAVLTVEPAFWEGLGEQATGRGDRMAVTSGERQLAVTGAAHEPILIVYDLGTAGPTAPAPPGPWQTRLTVLRRLEQSGVPAVQEGNLVMLQRLDGTEAELARAALRLSARSARLAQVLEDNMLAMLGGGVDRYVWLAQSEVERRLIGAPRR